eukprot:scaffold212551_cov26-Cyclotella_meneghiniana.AAC.1
MAHYGTGQGHSTQPNPNLIRVGTGPIVICIEEDAYIFLDLELGLTKIIVIILKLPLNHQVDLVVEW